MTAILAGAPRLGGSRPPRPRRRPMAGPVPESRRRATWSEPLSRSLTGLLRDASRARVLTAIKLIHTGIFATVGASIVLFVWDGFRQRRGRRAAYALGITLAESTIYLSNNRVCPLTPLAEGLGAERGSVADMFLPAWAARSIPILGTSGLLIGLVLNVRGLIRAQAE
jgi:hypothetical protein